MNRIAKGFGYRKHPNLLLPFLFGFIAGVVITNIWSDTPVLQTGFLSEYALERLQYIEVDGNKFFWYVIQNRLKLMGIILIAGTTILGALCSYLFAGWAGMSAGIMMSVLSIRFGMKGSFLYLVCILPQMLFYVPGFYRMLQECFMISCRLYFPNRIANYGIFHKSGKFGHFGSILAAVGVVIIGIFLESYVNPIFVEKVVKYFL